MTTLSFGQMKQLALNAGFTGSSANTITAIAMAESSGNPNAIAYNDGGKGYNSYGLTQINGVHPNAASATDPQTAFNMAYTLSNGGTNFQPWSTYNSGAYAQYLPNATVATPDSSLASGTGITSDPNSYTGNVDVGGGGDGSSSPNFSGGGMGLDPAPGGVNPDTSPTGGAAGPPGGASTNPLAAIGAFAGNWAVRLGLIAVGIVLIGAAAHSLAEEHGGLPAIPIGE